MAGEIPGEPTVFTPDAVPSWVDVALDERRFEVRDKVADATLRGVVLLFHLGNARLRVAPLRGNGVGAGSERSMRGVGDDISRPDHGHSDEI